jgi:hypothetical protein
MKATLSFDDFQTAPHSIDNGMVRQKQHVSLSGKRPGLYRPPDQLKNKHEHIDEEKQDGERCHA